MRILLIEDDEKLCEAIRWQLQQQGISCDWCGDGEEGLFWARQKAHDLILLDRMLPGMDGLEVLRQLRKEGIGTPVLLVTALGQVQQRVEGLDAGADDYITKPFAMEELLARVRAMGRRPRGLGDSRQQQCGGLVLLLEEKRLRGPAGEVSLSGREASLLELLMKHPGQTLSRAALLYHVWGTETQVEDGNLDNYIHFLRKRLRTVDPSAAIQTVRGTGYRLEVQ